LYPWPCTGNRYSNYYYIQLGCILVVVHVRLVMRLVPRAVAFDESNE
jgi:hypothetical protein